MNGSYSEKLFFDVTVHNILSIIYLPSNSFIVHGYFLQEDHTTWICLLLVCVKLYYELTFYQCNYIYIIIKLVSIFL